MSTPHGMTGTIALPAKCKLCGKTVGHFALHWPIDPDPAKAAQSQAEFGRMFTALGKHLGEYVMMFQPGGRRPAENTPEFKIAAEHAGVLTQAQLFGGNATTLYLARHFQLPPAAEDGYLEQVRGALNQTTAKFSLSVDDAEKLAHAIIYNALKVIESYAVPVWATFFENPVGTLEQARAEAEADTVRALLALAARYEVGHPVPGPADPKAN